MTAALALPSLLPGELHEQGMVIPPDLSFEAWESALRNAEWVERASPWWVVDLVAFGREKFHEDYTQALPDASEDADGFHQAKLRQADWMADRWPAGTRVTGQSYSAHRAVAKLDRPLAVALLKETDKDGRRLTVRALSRRADEIEERLRGGSQTIDGDVIEAGVLPWMPTEDDLTDDARRAMEQHAPQGKHRVAYVTGWLRCVLWNELRDNIREGRWPE